MIEVEVDDEAWLRDIPDAERVCARIADATLAACGAAGDVTILLSGDHEVRSLNVRFRGQDKATNVLSFPAPDSARPHLGDLALAHGVCAREAGEQHKALSDHLTHLVAHGVLHLLGYDHAADTEAEEMEALERRILAGLGIADPYAASPPHPEDAS